jgi:hypothetical protein
MRVIGEIPHRDCKITLYQWNNRYLIKLESGYFEQTFKIDQFELASEKELAVVLQEPFISEAVARFSAMEQSLAKALIKL